MEQTIKGFQYDPQTGRYVGEYDFPNNMDQEEIHLPPNTTLERPPVCEAGKIPVMFEGVWTIQMDPMSLPKKPPIDNYLMLTNAFIEEMERQGLWTDEDRRLREEAVAENERKKAEAEAAMAAQATGGAA